MRIVGLLFVFCLAFATVAGANLLTNPDFDQGATAWTISGYSWVEGWAGHKSTNGYACWGWTNSPGSAYQEVTVTSSGTYTFAVWVRREADFLSATNVLKLGWYDSGSGQLQPDSEYDFSPLPGDSQWHHIFVTGTCVSSALDKVRVTIDGTWTKNGGSMMFDQADLYAGTYVKSNEYLNNSFEATGSGQQRNSGWSCVPELHWGTGGGFASDSWSPRSGTNGVALYSWDPSVPNYSGAIIQNFNAVDTTGAYSFAIWIKREANALLSNVTLSIDWYDMTFTNKVQAGGLANLTVTNDNQWHEYYVTSTLTNLSFHEARVQLDMDWSFNPAGDPRSMMIDDARFIDGAYDGTSLIRDWAYHAGFMNEAGSETVPQTNVGTFMQIDYVNTQMVFYVLGDDPSQAKYYPEEGARWEMRTAWKNPYTDTWYEVWGDMTFRGPIDIGPGTEQLHGQPAAGSKTLNLYSYAIEMPKTNGTLLTNQIDVYYAPFIKSTNGVIQTDYMYLVDHNPIGTNNLTQLYGDTFADKDYWLQVNPTREATLQNPSFETPAGTNIMPGSQWQWWGDVAREEWGAHDTNLGPRVARFASWTNGNSGVFQDIVSTGGTYTFSIWIKPESGYNPSNLLVGMKWYNQNTALLQTNVHDFKGELQHDGGWYKVFVTGTCTSNDVYYVQPFFSSVFGDSTTTPNAVMFDDAELREVNGTLQNVGFEVGFLDKMGGWYCDPSTLGMIHEWANRSGSNGFSFHCYETNLPSYEATMLQPVVASTGTYEFSIWVKSEASVKATNMEMKLEWYDDTWSTKVQADTMETITVPTDGLWYQYTITGACSSADLVGVQPAVFTQWDSFTNTLSGLMIDDVTLVYSPIGPAETDGIPNSWLLLWGLVPTNGVGNGDDDSDTLLNKDEYAADSNPLDPTSSFTNIVVMATEGGVGNVVNIQMPWSTNSRTYFITYKTDLMDSGPWMPLGVEMQGNTDGSPLSLKVTNTMDYLFYRYGAKP